MNIQGSTKIVGLIGQPIEHTFSPPMHNAAFMKLGLDYVYLPFSVNPINLKSAISGAKSLSIQGLNVTIPHKIDVIKYLDELDEIAKLIGAVNTIDFKNLKGYNTDGIGAIKAIEEVSNVKNKNVIVAGAGGASRAISFYLAKFGVESLTILNRNVVKAEKLANDILNSDLIGNIKTDSLENISKYLTKSDILINTTPLGMNPSLEAVSIANANDMHEDLVVFDAVYNPNETVLLKEAIKAGAKPVYGIKMLLYQGAESFEIWTGKKAPIKAMYESLIKTLNL
ncbi:shikimate dehydrogenase [Methanobrevibacter oralis]|uniref:shikimate dehydrogenase n=1 Tax=Methanobrevibacter oralis TaxID=66851 RepID=UPI001C72D329|nr:shikimate dehydrogenase [Methanobrevibacter oralis]